MARRIVGAIVLLVALAGCGGDPKADPSPTPSTSPTTATASASASAPVLTSAAKKNSKAGAVAFVEHYVDLINYAQRTGELEPLQAVESPGCMSCTGARNALQAIFESGGHIDGGEWDAAIRSAAARPDLRAWSVFAAVTYGPQTITQGTTTKTLKGGRSVITFVVRRDAGAWSVLRWSRGS